MVDWNGGMEWTGMVISWILLIGFYLLIMTTSEQRPPVNKDHITLIAKYLSSVSITLKKRPPPYKDHFILRLKMVRMCAAGLYS